MSLLAGPPRTTAHRRDALWLAALVHRLSGILLACFLPLHFLALGLAIEGEAQLDGFLRWADAPAVKLAETALVFVLGVHLLGGLRILAIEAHGWRPGQHAKVIAALAFAGAIAIMFVWVAFRGAA